jgi:hypothetical protein
VHVLTYLAKIEARPQLASACEDFTLVTEVGRLLEESGQAVWPPAVTRDRILLFLHLAKTAGMTLSNILLRNFTGQHLPINVAEIEAMAIGTWSHRNVERSLALMQQSEIDQIRAVWGHFRHGIQSSLPKPCACVTLMRDPVDRVISMHYWYRRATYGDDGSGEPLEDYIRHRRHYDLWVDNYMTRVLSGSLALDFAAPGATTENWPPVTDVEFETAAKNLDDYLVVGLTDQFDETLLVLGADLHWSLSDLVYTSTHVTPHPTMSDVAESVRDVILSWNRHDAALVRRGRAHLARRIASYPGDFQKDLSLFRKLNALFGPGVPVEDLRRVECNAHA